MLANRAHLHGGTDLGHGLFGAQARAVGPVFENIRHVLLGVPRPAFLDWRKDLHEGIGGPVFAFDAADAGGATALIDFGERLGSGKHFVEIAYGADVGIARVGPPDARGVGDHGLEFLAQHGLGIGDQDGVAVALGHLAAVG